MANRARNWTGVCTKVDGGRLRTLARKSSGKSVTSCVLSSLCSLSWVPPAMAESADSLSVAMDGATCDKKTEKLLTTRDEADGDEVNLPPKVDKTIEAVKEDLEKTQKVLDGMTNLGLKKVVPPSAKVAPALWYDVPPPTRKPPAKVFKTTGQHAMLQVRFRRGAKGRGDQGSRSRVAPEP